MVLIIFLQIQQDVGIGKGKYYALNFPLRDGISNENYKSVFEPVRNAVEHVSSYRWICRSYDK